LSLKGASANQKNVRGETPLVLAAQNGTCNLSTIKILLQGSDDATRKSCLWSLSSRGSQENIVEFLQLLISTGVSIESRDRQGRTPLLAQSTSGLALKALVECGAQLDATDSNESGLLHCFVSNSGSSLHLEGLQELVDMGLDPLQVDNQGNSLLHEAVKRYSGTPQHVAFIQRLLKYGLSPNATNLLGRSPLHIHMEVGSVWSSDTNCTRTSLLQVLQGGNIAPDVNIQDQEGLLCLHIASMHSEVHVARLLQAGADPSFVMKTGRNAFHLACRARKSGLVGLLLSTAASDLVNKLDSFEISPLHDACTSGRPKSVYYLLKSGADINAKGSRGRTPLHCCAKFPAEQAIWSSLQEQNIAAGQFVHDRFRPKSGGSFGHPPWYSRSYGYPSFSDNDSARIGGIIKLLLASGADVLSFDASKFSPLDLALKYNCRKMINGLALVSEDLQKSHHLDNGDFRLQTEIALKQRTTTGPISGPPLQELLKRPSQYLTCLTPEDTEWISQLRKNKHCEPSGDEDCDYPFVLYAAEKGLTELVERLGDEVQYYSDPESVRQDGLKSKGNRYTSSVEPVLHVACSRELPNMEMLELLVKQHSVDLNVRALVPHQQYGPLKDFVQGGTALHHLAEAKFWWQLDAM
jgi:ankyrin repeat protein